MYTRGYAKHPCTRVVCSRGLAVGRVERYARIGRTANPSEQTHCVHEGLC